MMNNDMLEQVCLGNTCVFHADQEPCMLPGYPSMVQRSCTTKD